MSSRLRWRIACLLLLGAGCGGGGSKHSTTKVDAGAETPVSADAGPVVYHGPTHGGAIPTGPKLQDPPLDPGPFKVDSKCCDRVLKTPASGDEQSVTVVGNLPPVNGKGLPAKLANGIYSVTACMPIDQAVQYRFVVETVVDGGTQTAYRTGSDDVVTTDEAGNDWNLSVIHACK